MEPLQCPACGSRDIEIQQHSRTYGPPYGTTISIPLEVDTCRVCGESGDFGGHNDEVIKSAIEEADHNSVEAMLESLGAAGISMAFLERALGLPTRTIARWKSGGCSASGAALLRIVRTFPWVLEVAAAQFATPVARRELLHAAADVIEQATAEAGQPGRSRRGETREGEPIRHEEAEDRRRDEADETAERERPRRRGQPGGG